MTHRLKMTFTYFYKSAANLCLFFFIFMVFIFAFAVFSHNVWGSQNSDFSTFESSLVNFILSTVGIYNLSNLSRSNPLLSLILIFLIFLLMIYFFMSTFSGILIESYRLTSLKDGHPYDMRKSSEVTNRKNRNSSHQSYTEVNTNTNIN